MKYSLTLVVMSRERRLSLLGDLRTLRIETLEVATCQAARDLLQTRPPVDLIITDVSLPDGNWCDIFKYVVDSGIEASVIVSSPRADEILWSEVLWRGAYDLLVEPYQRGELQRTIEGALRTTHSAAADLSVGSASVGPLH